MRFDDELLGRCETVLGGMGFSTALTRIRDVPCLLAENSLFILAVVCTEDVESLVDVDEAVSLQLASDVAAAGVADKQWDVYLVMLTSERLPAEQGDAVYRLAYDTHYLRRVVRTGVVATDDGVTGALNAFATMPETEAASFGDPLEELELALRERGIPGERARSAIQSFRVSGEIRDA